MFRRLHSAHMKNGSYFTSLVHWFLGIWIVRMRLHITCEAHAEKTQRKDVCHLILLSSAKSAVVRTIVGGVPRDVLVLQQRFCLKNTELIYVSFSKCIARSQISYMIVAKSAF